MADLILESRKACKQFGGLKAVNDVDMQVERGQIYGIIGPNGAGKTTFFNICAGTFPVSGGRILFDGQDITNQTSVQVAKLGIARTFQNLQIFGNMTVLQNVIIGFHLHTRTTVFDSILHTRQYKRDEEKVAAEGTALLEKLELLEYKDTLAKNLAYGTQRKVEIARALALSPKLLLLDEPAAGMNPMETMSLLEFVKKIRDSGVTVIVIEHDMKFVMNLCDYILVLNHGEKLAEGLPQEIAHNAAVKEAYFGKGILNVGEEAGHA